MISDAVELVTQRQRELSRQGFVDAQTSKESPEDTAKRLQRSRMFEVPPSQVKMMTPEETAAKEADLVDWAAMQVQTPVMARKLQDVNFANLVRDDLSNTGLLEEAVWRLSPKSGRGRSAFERARAAGARGAFNAFTSLPLFGSVHEAIGYQEELNKLQATEQAIADGIPDNRLFGTEDDPTGAIGRRAFEENKELVRSRLLKQIRSANERTAWANRVASYFPASFELEEFQKNTEGKGFGESVEEYAKDFWGLTFEVGAESASQMIPTLAASAAAGIATGGWGAVAAGAQMLTTFIGSYFMDKAAGISGDIAEGGVDLTDPEALTAYMTDPNNAGKLAEIVDSSEWHALGTAALDAVSMGIADKTFLPKALSNRLASMPVRNALTKTAVQLPVQASLGGAGEALGQYLADGEITSWADVVAEMAGEFSTAPFEVAVAGTRAMRKGDDADANAQQFAQGVRNVADAVNKTKLAERDPESAKQLVDEVGREAGVEQVSINVGGATQESVRELIRQAFPEREQELNQAFVTGSAFKMSLSDYVTRVVPLDPEGKTLVHIHSSDNVSITDIGEAKEAMANSIKEKVEKDLSERAAVFRADLKDVGTRIGKLLRDGLTLDENGNQVRGGMSRDEAYALQAVMQTLIAALAKDSGMLPSEVWERYGLLAVLGPQDFVFEKGGAVKPTTERGRKIFDSLGIPGYIQSLRATGNFNVRPNGIYYKAIRTIARWANNKSTFLHETAHLYLGMRLDMLRDRKSITERPKSLGEAVTEGVGETAGQARMWALTEELLAWLGFDSLEAWDNATEAQRQRADEKFARTFEAYVMEGRAPTKGLARVFAKFKDWLRIVYVTVLGIPGQQLSDESRLLFDNLFIAQEQVQEAVFRRHGDSLYGPNGAPLENAAEYQQVVEDMEREAVEEQTARNIKMNKTLVAITAKRDAAIEREVKKGERAKNKIVREEREAIKKTPGYTLRKILRKGRLMPNGDVKKFKLLAADLKALGLTEAQIEALHKDGVVTLRRSPYYIDPQAVADEYGYVDAKEMVQDLLQHTDEDKMVADRVKERVQDEIPNYISREAIEEAVDASLFNKSRIKMIGMEIRDMEKRVSSQRPVVMKAFEGIVEKLVEKMSLDGISPREAMRNATTARRNARRAFKKGEYDAVLKFKRQELFQSMLAKRIKEAKADAARKNKQLKNLSGKKKIASVNNSHLMVVQQILAACGYSKAKKLGLNKVDGPLSKYVQDFLDAKGIQVMLTPEVVAALDKGDMSGITTVKGFTDLYNLVSTIKRDGNLEIKDRKAEEKLGVEEAQNVLGDAVTDAAKKRGKSVKAERERTGRWAQFLDAISNYKVAHIRMPSLFAAMEGRRGGVFFDHIIRPKDECDNTEANMRREYAKKLDSILKPLEPEFRSNKKYRIKAFNGHAFTKMELFAMACNLGNEGNAARLVDGAFGMKMDDVKWSRDLILAGINEVLTAEDWARVQQIWDTFEEVRVETNNVISRMNGRPPKWVEPTAFSITDKNGKTIKLKGGYYPIVRDRKASTRGRNMDEANNETGTMSLSRMTLESQVFAGHLKERAEKVGDKAPLTLTMRGLFEGLDRNIHYIAWVEWVNYTRKLLAPGKPLETAIKDYWGSDFVQAINNWIDTIAEGGYRSDEMGDVIANFLRSNISVAGLGLNVVSAAIQIVGAVQSIPVVGAKWMAVGTSDYLKMGPLKSLEFAKSRSDVMRDRSTTQFREIAEVQRRINGTSSTLNDKISQYAYVLIIGVQMVVDTITWLGAYERAVSDPTIDEAKAVALADRMLQDAQGSGRLSELSGIETGNPWKKLITVFYTFFNTALQVVMVSYHTEKRMKFFMDAMLIMVMQPVLEVFLRDMLAPFGGDDDEDADEWAERMAKESVAGVVDFGLGMLVGVREFNGLVNASLDLDYYGYRGPTGTRKISDLSNAYVQLAVQQELDDPAVKAAINVMGSFGGLPSAALNRLYTGGKALYEGDTDNPFALFLGYKD